MAGEIRGVTTAMADFISNPLVTIYEGGHPKEEVATQEVISSLREQNPSADLAAFKSMVRMETQKRSSVEKYRRDMQRDDNRTLTPSMLVFAAAAIALACVLGSVPVSSVPSPSYGGFNVSNGGMFLYHSSANSNAGTLD